jgi:hypothetical protein
MSRGWPILLLFVPLACRGEDAYLGGSLQSYTCGSRCLVEQGAPDDAGDWFFNPEAERGEAPSVVYPLTDSEHPIDLRQLTVQFRRGRDDFRVFRVRLESIAKGVAYDFFTPCLSVQGDGCRYLLQGPTWNAAREELLGVPARLTVTGSTGKRGVLKTSVPVPLGFTESQLSNKGFYYWTTVARYTEEGEKSDTGIFRLPFGADQAEPFLMPNTATNRRQCGACHSVSRDGSTIAFTARQSDGGPDQRSGSLVAVRAAAPDSPFIDAPMIDTYDSSMMALSKNGTRVLVAYDDQLQLRSAEDSVFSDYGPGDVIVSLSQADLGNKIGFFPEFSPDDDAVVLTLSSQPDSAIAVQAGDIAVIDVDILNATFGTPRVIVEGSEELFHFYPTWSPDGKYVAFASAPRELDENGAPRKSYDQKKARLRLVRREGGDVYELGKATQGAEKWSTYPKFAPWNEGESGKMFLTFNSKMSYGLLVDNDSMKDDQRLAQLWMSVIDVSKLPEDPSSAPVWLPFQDASQPSHLGLWTSDVKCRTDLGGRSCDFGQECNPDTKTCQVIVK